MDEVIKQRSLLEKRKPRSLRTKHSRSSLLREANYLSEVRILKLWRRGKSWPSVERLAELATVLDCDVKRLCKHLPASTDDTEPEDQYAELIISSLLTKEFDDYARGCGGYRKAEVKSFVAGQHPIAIYELNMTEREKDSVLTKLCRQGWLTKERDRHPPLFYLRPWTKRQCEMALKCRIANEQLAVCAAAVLRYVSVEEDADAKADYKQIKALQEHTLREMKLVTQKLRTNQDDVDLVYELILLDSKFHRNWAGNDPTMQRVIAYVVSCHQQLIMRLVLAQDQLGSAGMDLPAEFPTLATVVDSFYDECLEIYTKFLAVGEDVCSTTGLHEGEIELREAVEQHPQNGFTHVEAALQLETIYRRRS